MIIGTGIDVVNIDRFARLMERNPVLLTRLFVEHERGRPHRSLAARFAAKEAVAKALGAPVGMVWQHCWIENTDDGAPHIVVEGTVARVAHELGVNRWHLTMTHDEPIAMASVIAEHLSKEELMILSRLSSGSSAERRNKAEKEANGA